MPDFENIRGTFLSLRSEFFIALDLEGGCSLLETTVVSSIFLPESRGGLLLCIVDTLCLYKTKTTTIVTAIATISILGPCSAIWVMVCTAIS